jgi:hypothetical protein
MDELVERKIQLGVTKMVMSIETQEEKTDLEKHVVEAEQWEFPEKEQTLERISHLHKGVAQSDIVDDNESEQRTKWEEFLTKGSGSEIEKGANLLQYMEMTEEGLEDTGGIDEEKMELDKEVIEKITVARSLEG